jgi:hypothetical protein
MPPLLLLSILVACLLALLPVWRLKVAGWPTGWLVGAWLTYTVMILAVLRIGPAVRFLVPVIVLAYIAPFVAGPERLTRVLAGRKPPPRPIINVTPAPPPGLEDGDPDDEGTDRR